MSYRVRRGVAVALLAVAAASCSKKLDTTNLEATVAHDVEQQLNTSGVTVSCPTDVPVTQGGTFTCHATDANGTNFTISVRQMDEDGNVRWEVSDVTK
jgi:Domain of unknown function (DUF4333)